jgi:lipooligosaccharide transport system permease protein
MGEVAAMTMRATAAATCFLAIVVTFGMVQSWWALLALPAIVLITFAFAGAGVLVATIVKEFYQHQYIQLVMLPMFLFATTFYPLSVYSKPLQVVVTALPLYQSTELLRGLTLGDLGPSVAWAGAYLAVMGMGGLWLANRRLPRILLG